MEVAVLISLLSDQELCDKTLKYIRALRVTDSDTQPSQLLSGLGEGHCQRTAECWVVQEMIRFLI